MGVFESGKLWGRMVGPNLVQPAGSSPWSKVYQQEHSSSLQRELADWIKKASLRLNQYLLSWRPAGGKEK